MVTKLIVAISLRYMNISNDYAVHLEWITNDTFVTPCTVAHQAALSMGFPRQEYWSGLPCPPSGDILDPLDLNKNEIPFLDWDIILSKWPL